MSERERAKAAVANIARRYGSIRGVNTISRSEAWNPGYPAIGRSTSEERTLVKDMFPIKSILKIIFSLHSQFVLDLLRIIDKSPFTQAQENGHVPFLRIQVHPNRIIVDCNEDGFTEDDLSTLRAIGETIKSRPQSPGHPSDDNSRAPKCVFEDASIVCIQSGAFSFYFKQGRGSTDLEITKPIWMDTEERLERPLTRLTLYWHAREGSPRLKPERSRENILTQLAELRESSLLFVRSLRKVLVLVHDSHGDLEHSTVFSLRDLGNHRVAVDTVLTQSGRMGASAKYYHVTRGSDLTLSSGVNDENNQEPSIPEVVLAFPLTRDSRPIIERQHTSAFLPLGLLSNFKFLIHADFDVELLDHQDIVTTTPRNRELLDAIAVTFVKAILQFCKHEHLCYTWPSFLPSPDDDYSSAFWAGLAPKIKAHLEHTPVLRSRHRRYLRKISDLRIPGTAGVRSYGTPLFDDASTDFYVSDKYSFEEALTPLMSYGLNYPTFQEYVDALKLDISSPVSAMRSKPSGDEWHSAVARLLCAYLLKQFGSNQTTQLKNLPILPLASGGWTSLSDGEVYLPTTEGISIPTCVNMRIVDHEAVADQDRKRFFVLLGVSEPSISKVRSLILQAYSDQSADPVSPMDSKAHLHYLYLTHFAGTSLWEIFDYIKIYSEGKRTGIAGRHRRYVSPRHRDVYLPSGHVYGPEVLLKPSGDVPGFPATFIHPDYLRDEPEPPSLSHPTWTSWLRDVVGVRERLRLVSADGDTLSGVWHYVREHRPEKVLGLLEYLWIYEGRDVIDNGLVDDIKGTDARRLCGAAADWTEFDLTLQDTWLPLPHLRTLCSQYMRDEERFPFLSLDDFSTGVASPEELSAKWSFLHTEFSVGGNDNIIHFYLEILQYIYCVKRNHEDIPNPERVVDVYIAIYGEIMSSKDSGKVMELVRTSFEDNEHILIPKCGYGVSLWRTSRHLLWDAPLDVARNVSLKHAYEQLLGRGSAKFKAVARFFQDVLSIKSAELQVPRRSPHVGVFERLIQSNLTSDRHAPRSSSNSDPLPRLLEPSGYRELLHQVVSAARTATFPSRGAFDMSTVADNLSESTGPNTSITSFDGLEVAVNNNRVKSSLQHNREVKVGAAGELYVFELLSHPKSTGEGSAHRPILRNFSRSNWKSTIRRFVTGNHPDYDTLEPWRGRETADFTYEDVYGDMTALLKQKGYLDDEEHSDGGGPGLPTMYFIEVKTTTGPCETPFYMSKSQYQRMRDTYDIGVNINIQRRKEVFMVLRVFNIAGERPGLRVYLEPEKMRLDGGLVFTGESWSVVPGPGH